MLSSWVASDPDFCVRQRRGSTPGLCAEGVRVDSGGRPGLTLLTALQHLPHDAWLLFATRFIRLFAYGALSVVLVFYLVGVGLSEPQTGMLLTLTLVGDTAVSLVLTTRADRIGRRRTLIVGAMLMAAAGLVFALTRNPWFLVLAGTIGVVSPSGNEVGPFLSIEQAARSRLGHHTRDRRRRPIGRPISSLAALSRRDRISSGWRTSSPASPRGAASSTSPS